MYEFCFSLLKSTLDNAASRMRGSRDKNDLMSFWRGWLADSSEGYPRGRFANINLTKVPREYTVVAFAFMKGNGISVFKPFDLSDEEFQRQVSLLKSHGRVVLISLRGANAYIELNKGSGQPFANEIIRLVETYGFDGLDIDLELSAIDFAYNKYILPAALKIVKDHYASEGKDFIISMALEFTS